MGGTPVGITKSTNEDYIYVGDWFNSEILMVEIKSLAVIKIKISIVGRFSLLIDNSFSLLKIFL